MRGAAELELLPVESSLNVLSYFPSLMCNRPRGWHLT